MKKKMAKTLAVLMCLMTAVAFMPTFAFAAETEETAEPVVEQQDEPAEEQQETSNEQSMEVQETTEPAEDANVKITVSNQGVLAADKNGKVMAYRDVVASDIDKDGRITVDEALVAAHNSYLAGGAAENYDNGGGFVNKLWGVSSTNNLFFINGIGLSSGVLDDTIDNNDELYVSINKDSTYWADWFTSFDAAEKRVEKGENFELALTGCQGMAYPFEPDRPVNGVAIGIWEGGAFSPVKKTTDEDGKVTLSFDETGIYYVTAAGTVKDEVIIDWTSYETKTVDCPIMAPVIKVTVYDDNSVSLAEAKADAVKTLSESYNINDYRGFVQMNVLTKVLAGIAEINAADTTAKIDQALGKAMKAISEIKTDAQMTKEENAVSAVGIKTISVKAGKKKATVSWSGSSVFTGYQIYYKQAKKSAKYTTTTAKSKAIKSLKKKSKVAFKVRGYKVMNGKTVYGKWSASKTVKIK